jgi:hypothetical protein
MTPASLKLKYPQRPGGKNLMEAVQDQVSASSWITEGCVSLGTTLQSLA